MSRTNLEQILELLLAEDNDRAEEMLHEYVVAKARAEYERVLDESEEEVEEVDEAIEEEVDEAIDQSNDFEDDILADEEEIEADETGLEEDEEDFGDEMDFGAEDEGEEDFGDADAMDMDDVEGEDDIEDKVEDLEAELEDLRAEFEKLLADEMDEPEHDDLDLEAGEDEGDEEVMDSVEYDLEEATNFSDKVKEQPITGATLKGSEADSTESPLSKAPKATKVAGAGAPVKAKDGSEGKKDASAKDHTPTNNIKVKPSKAAMPKKGE